MSPLRARKTAGAVAGLAFLLLGVCLPMIAWARVDAVAPIPTLRQINAGPDDFQSRAERLLAERGIRIDNLEKGQVVEAAAREAMATAIAEVNHRLDKLEWLSYAVLVFIAPIGGAFATHWGKTLLRVFGQTPQDAPAGAEK